MTGAARRIADLDVFRTVDLEEIGFRLLRWDVVLHLLRQLGVRPVQEPQAPEGVVHQVAHDPVRGEQLGGGRNIFCCDLLIFLQRFKYRVLFLGDVELVQPADDFHVLTGVGRHGFTGIG
ncbi:hypothetical protein D3C84_558060 [compost metagenome]